ncbi:hypothetical protein FHR99_002940 [Litorivivens lipolytica]|uniref:Porin n=1 Tax=Litorivivens lipolytica TaxID=1524264 RepID=A0A7W4W731_9GAMM|nr:hypothetical protein [Litorivivens lipolytica]MBB3048666.1 hypothetical protein [Litorivivens lipolytica]
MRKHLLLSPLLVAASLFSPLSANAELRWSAFATLGAVYNQDDKVKFIRNLSQPSGPEGSWSTLPDTIVGGQLHYFGDSNWDAMLQAVSTYDYTSNYVPRITWAYARYSPNPDFSVRFGRIGYDAYMQGDSRNIGFATVTVRPPIEYYGTVEMTYIDGVDVVFQRPIGEGIGVAKLFYGYNDEEVPLEDGENLELEGTPVVGGYLEYQWSDWRVRAGVSNLKFNNTVPSLSDSRAALKATGFPPAVAAADQLDNKDTHLTNWNIGTLYNGSDWYLQLLYGRRQSESRVLADADTYYALLGHRFGRFMPYLGFAQSDAQASFIPLGIPGMAPFRSTLFEQENWHTGVRFDISNNMSLKVQVEYIHADETQDAYFREVEPDWDGDTAVFSIALDMIFQE